ncbi:MAG: DUF2189 domain-containing protein [Leptothrix sp. (in: b-proteobacteria)]
MAHVVDHLHPSTPLPTVRNVAVGQPLLWLYCGYADLKSVPRFSLAYGALIAAFGVALLAIAWEATYLVPALIGGFLLVAPFLAIVFYKLSMQLEEGDSINKLATLGAWRHNRGSIALFGLMLAVALIGWERLSAILFALFYGGQVPDLDHLVSDVLFSGHYTGLAIAYMGTGALVAAAVFAFSVVTTQLLMDRDLDVISAALTSLKCCSQNLPTMVVWAAVIAVLTAIGFATFMLGLVLIFPLLGHASWHAYRDLVE